MDADGAERPVAVLDIDGVVADVRHRLHHLEGRPKNWDAFFAGAHDDPPLADGLALARELAAGHRLIWLTGRPETLRRVTSTWLRTHGLPAERLVMRRSGDYRPARVYKLGTLRRLGTVATFVDDDAEVVAAARQAGFPAVLADWALRAADPQDTAALREAQENDGRT